MGVARQSAAVGAPVRVPWLFSWSGLLWALFGFYLFVVDAGLSWLIDKVFRAAGVIA